MDVGIVTPRYPPNVAGGGEISVSLLAENLQDSDRIDDLTVLSFDGTGTEIRNGVEVCRLADISSFLTEWQNVRAISYLRKHVDQFDVIHAYNMELHPAVGFLSERRDIGTVGTLNSYHFFPKSTVNVLPGSLERLYELLGYPTTGRILRYYIGQMDELLALSEAVKNIYVNHGFRGDNISTVPNCLDASFEVPQIDTPDESDAFSVLYAGELSEIKGVEYLIRAFKHLESDYHLKIVGDGPLFDELTTLAEKLNLTNQITLVGHVNYKDIPKQYATTDIFVHPGVWPEPFSRTLLEAMQAELPVVATDIGGSADVVMQPKLRCPPRDPEALARAIKRARQNASDIGRQNKEYVYETFSPSTVTSQIIDVYERVCD